MVPRKRNKKIGGKGLLEKHHVIFKSQGGLDFFLNYEYLNREDHRGDLGPHKNREVDLKYKRELEENLVDVLKDRYYSIDTLVEVLGLDTRQANRAFKKVKQSSKGIAREDVIKRLLGDRFYL